MTAQSKGCKDCSAEMVQDLRGFANPRMPGSSYCSHHIYQRTKVSKLRTKIRDIVTLLKSPDPDDHLQAVVLLNVEDGSMRPKLPMEILDEFAKSLDAEAESIINVGQKEEHADEWQMFRDGAFGLKRIAFTLRFRKLPTEREAIAMRAKCDPRNVRDL